MSQNAPRKLPVVVGLVFLIGTVLFKIWILPSLLQETALRQRIGMQLIFAWAIAVVLIMLVMFWERKPLSSIGIRRLHRKDVLGAIAGFLLGGVIIMITMPIVEGLGLGSTEGGVRYLSQFSVWFRMFMVLTAAVTEEILYRGYLVERLNILTNRIGLSTLLSYLLFVALHLSFWGIGGLLQIGLGSIVLYGLYLWRRNLLACMLMHALNNAVAFLVIPMFLPS